MGRPHIAKQVELPLSEWAPNLHVPMLQMENGDGYIPVKPLVQQLVGPDADEKAQRRRIDRDIILSQLKCYLPVQTTGGQQEMLCLPWIGIGRFIDRIDLTSVREPYQSQLLTIMWAITFAAFEVISGRRVLPNLITIIPGDRVLANIPEQDVRRLLGMLIERIGRMEIANRGLVEAAGDMKSSLMALLGAARPAQGRCPCCGQTVPADAVDAD